MKMTKDTALEMAEAFSTDCMNELTSLGDDAEPIVGHCWEEIEVLRDTIRNLNIECRRLRSELDEANGVIR